MILTNCAACAAPLAHNAPRCVRCHTRYCNQTCQHDHWRRGHKQICKKIHRGGNAEQYHADKKYKEAVAEAVEACADDTKGQTCYICTQALHWKTKEGLVRGCACRGTAGFAHVSCLVEQAKILMDEAEENNLENERLWSRWQRWSTCSLCEQEYHGVVAHALGWACWKTYVGRPETDAARVMAMNQLGNGLFDVKRHAERLSVLEAKLATDTRLGLSEDLLLGTKSNIALSHDHLGRTEEALGGYREVYAKATALYGTSDQRTAVALLNLSNFLDSRGNSSEAISLLRHRVPVLKNALGAEHETYLKLCCTLGQALAKSASLGQLREAAEAVAILETASRTSRRVFGPAHPMTVDTELVLTRARRILTMK